MSILRFRFEIGDKAKARTDEPPVERRARIAPKPLAAGVLFFALAVLIAPSARAIFSIDESGGGAATLIRERALVAFDGRFETLIVEPAARVQVGRAFVWAIPVPTEPEVIRPVSAGALNTLEFVVRPRVVTHNMRGLVPALIAGGLGLLLGALFVVGRRDIRRAFLVPAALMTVVASVAAVGLGVDWGEKAEAFPTLDASRPAVTDYELSKAASVEELTVWMARNGLGKPAGATKAALDEYQSRGWGFVMARTKGAAPAGEFTLQPIEIRFRAEAPYFPLRLNAAAADGGVDTLLFVQAPEPAADSRFRVEFSDAYAKKPADIIPSAAETVRPEVRQPIRSEHYEDVVINDQDDLNRLFPAEGWITRLRATLHAPAMDKDMVFLRPDSPLKRARAFTTRAAAARSAVVFLWIAAIAIPLAGLLARRRSRVEPGAGLGIGAAVAMIVAFAVFFAQPRAAAARVLDSPSDSEQRARLRIEGELAAFADVDPPAGETLDRMVARTLGGKYRNPYTGQPMREEASPGNFTLDRTLTGGLTLALYDRTMTARRLPAPLRVGRYLAKAVIQPKPAPTPPGAKPSVGTEAKSSKNKIKRNSKNAGGDRR